MDTLNITNRANTEDEKREILDRLFVAWLCTPELRLGQLLDNALYPRIPDMFNIEDFMLIGKVEAFVEKQAKQ